MMASRLNHRKHVIPALTDHLEDKGGVVGSKSSIAISDSVNWRSRISAIGLHQFRQLRDIRRDPRAYGTPLAAFHSTILLKRVSANLPAGVRA